MPTFLITGLFAGGVIRLEPDGGMSGISKTLITDRVSVNEMGLVGDVHCDTRVHGGREKAVHQFSTSSYNLLAQQAPESKHLFIPGSIGENISAVGMNETNVCIGDIYRAGKVTLQVSQPRSPCWKIDQHFDTNGLVTFIAQNRITGWYFRVLESGELKAGDMIELLDRPNPSHSIDYFWKVQTAHRPELDELFSLADNKELSDAWRGRLYQRVNWLKQNK